MADGKQQYYKDFYDHFSTEYEEDTQTKSRFEGNVSNSKNNPRSGKMNKNYGRGRSQNQYGGRKKDTRNPRNHNLKEIDRTQLVDLELKNPDDIIIFFSKNNQAFNKLLNDVFDFNKIVLFLRVISKLCSSSFVEYKTKIIKQISNKEFLQKLQIRVSNIDGSQRRENLFFWENQRRFWIDLYYLYSAVFDCCYKTALKKLPNLIETNIKILKANDFSDIVAQFEELLLKIESEKLKIDNFRNMDIFPTVREITTKSNPKIQSLIIQGSYKLIETYLDIHFRLYREDYVRSLRNGICSYLENKKVKQFDMRFYENIKFIRPHISKDRVGILVKYSDPIKEISSENKYFQYGSLLCFTKDNFRTVTYGTVLESDTKLLLTGFLVVDVQDSILYGENYLMVETTIRFENYYHVLKALQTMKDENFPMKKYLIDVSTKGDSPAYLKETTKIKLFPKNAEVDEKDQILVGGMPIKKFKILGTGWPPKEYFKLNSSQFVAFKAALTSEFSVIQGPPGTGKTYTTHRIVEFLLKHKQSLNYSGPILVLCYTNHALDQFLEGILPFSNNIVRVGTQSKNPKMDDFNLRNHRRKIETERDSFCKELFDVEQEKYNQCIQKLECLQNLLEDITCKTGIIDFKLFKIIDDKLKNSWFDKTNNEDIIKWLMPDYNMEPTNVVSFAYPREVIQKPNSKEGTQEAKIIKQHKMYDPKKDFVKNCILTLKELETKIEDLKAINEHYRFNKDLREYQRKEEYLQWRLAQTGINFNLLDRLDYNNPYNITPNERWELYRCWVHRLHLQAYEDISVLDEEYRAAKRRYQEVQQMIDVYIMQEKSVIGMTTSAAARLQPVLQTLKCEVVIVEEAAEVLESHIVAALTNHCQQLILIGDHLQLRPNTTQYILAKDFNLEISLFERMINNGVNYYQLDVQHRMRPEFARLIISTIYPYLKNDEQVKYYPPVRGMAKNLFFITHNQLEQKLRESTSHKNVYEAFYLLNFAYYLFKQGYTTEDITILTTYIGQLNLLTTVCKEHFPELENTRITTVDNFQGEENKIILLSLVRSNEKENIGFLKIENRVCVALSRAKEGFYMIGNMGNLEKDSVIWPKIISILTELNSIGPNLPLRCQNHGYQTQIEHYTDFKKIPEGGCNYLCEKPLKCGHKCKKVCHISDNKHEFYICEEKCKKTICYRNHFCPNLCSEKCSDYCEVLVEKFLKCGHKHNLECSKDISDFNCTKLVNKKLICGHEQFVQCSADTSKVACTNNCNKLIACGHNCKNICHINKDPNHLNYICNEPCKKVNKNCSLNSHKCTKKCYEICDPCTEIVYKKRSVCSHLHRIACNTNVDDITCTKICGRTMPCGHECTNPCYKPCGNCRALVRKKRTLCNHVHSVHCCADVDKIDCTQDCGKIMQCGHSCMNSCNKPCGNCQVMVFKMVDFCSHVIEVQCGIIPQRYMCRNKCQVTLKCGHKCKKNCNEECECSKCGKCTIS